MASRDHREAGGIDDRPRSACAADATSARDEAIVAVRYGPVHRSAWDEFVARAKNGVFMFRRDYMEYHADRFADHSLVFMAETRPIALLPASVDAGTLVSHGGLTFGGMVTDDTMRSATMLRIFAALTAYLRDQRIVRLVYKAVPHIYHRVPAEEDLYALYRYGARLVRRDLSSTIAPGDRLAPSKGRRWSLKQSRVHGVEVRRSDDFAGFMAIEAELLRSKYGLQPVHTAAELALLAGRFPDNIKLFAAYKDDAMLAGVCVYESSRVAHAQYIAATAEGKRIGALDAILDRLLNEHYAAKPYFDFGISTELDGRYLNAGLLANKESFGARAVVYDFYELGV
jgi:GNAT acetyltransferase-like protein